MAATTVSGQRYKANTVCVTGATGFLGSSLIKRLLHKGYNVHATVRDPGNEIKVRHLLDIPGAEETLNLFRAELSEDGSFDAAVYGCDGVFHVASPVHFPPKDPEAYAVAKTLAEKAALQYGKERGLDVVTINPVLVLGTSIIPSVPSTFELTLPLLTGENEGIEALKSIQAVCGNFPLVHVDDVSSAHIFLMENLTAEGRYICCLINISVPQLAQHLSKRYPQYNVPEKTKLEIVLFSLEDATIDVHEALELLGRILAKLVVEGIFFIQDITREIKDGGT